MNVSVKLPSGEILSLEGIPRRVEVLKERIERVTSIPATCQELIHGGSPLELIPEVEELAVDLIVRIGRQYAIASASLPPLPGVETFRTAPSVERARNFELFEWTSHRCRFSDNRPLANTTDISRAEARANTRLEPYRARAEIRRTRLKDLCTNCDGTTLLAMTFNSPYAPLFENWHRSCRHHGFDVRACTVVFPMDARAESVAKHLGYMTFFDTESYGSYRESTTVRFGDGQWIDCLFMKNAVVGDMLATGFDVLFQDVDIVWRRNPIPYLRNKAHLECWDFMFQKAALNPIFQPLYYNSGFVYARSNEFSRLTWERVLDNQRYCYVYRSQQAPVNIVMNTFRERGLRTCALDESLFVNGHRIPVKPKSDSGQLHPGAFMIHFNWNDSLATKLERLRDNGVWYTDGDSARAPGKGEASAESPQEDHNRGGRAKPSAHRWHALCIVSHRLRCIYVSIAKNASSTIKDELRRLDNESQGLHCTHVPDELWRDYTTFTFLRDPVARVLSAYQEISMRLENAPRDDLPFAKLEEGLERFDAFLDRIEAGPWDDHVCSQVDMVGDHRIDFWGRVEAFHDDFARLSARLGIGHRPPLPHRRSRVGRARDYGYSKHLLWERDLPPETVERIRKIYAEDLQLLESLRLDPSRRSRAVPPSADGAPVAGAQDDHRASTVQRPPGSWTEPVVRRVQD